MTNPVSQLPDDVDALKAMIAAMAQERLQLEARNGELEARNSDLEASNTHLEAVNKTAAQRIARLTELLKELRRAHYGRRSERLSEDQFGFVFEEIQIGIAAAEEELAKAGGEDKAKRAPRPRKGFAEHLERIEVVIEPETPPGCEDLDKVLIGEDVSERLDVIPAQFRVIVTHRPKYAYKGFDGVFQAPAPAHLIEGGIPTEALLAHIAVAKYADGLPLYRVC
ncbi:hypothetical protein AU467_32545 [Mesorhizobium loti]|uniref:Transposase n=1 Tax=Rhizobium loti TaxID=381 RepID=A0A101KN35_RHILI|nr:hypothetical protein AU467_32545 [Mesorhizobium loti]